MKLTPLLLAIPFMAFTAGSAGAQTFQFDTPIAGDTVPVQVSVSDTPAGVEFSVEIEPGSGDLLGFFANVADESLLPGLSILDETGLVTGVSIGADSVTQVGGGNNVRPVKSWDLGVRIGNAGSAAGAVTSATFTVRAEGPSAPALSASQFTSAINRGFIFGVRIQGTLGPEGSSKMGLMETMAESNLEIVAPSDQALLNTLIVDVSGLASGVDQVEVQGVDVVQATIVDGVFLATEVLLNEGPNTISVTGTGADGIVMDSIQVVVDTQPPLITVLTPADGSTTTDESVIVIGTATDANGVQEVFVQGETASLDPDGSFIIETTLDPGLNTLLIEAVDAAGNIGSTEVSITFVSNPEQ